MQRQDHLRDLLRALEPADAVESQHKAEILSLLDTTRAPFAREQYEPGHVTASAFVVNAERDALLLILHGKLKRWLQPGGHVDPEDSDVITSARREVREETALERVELLGTGILDVDVHEIPARSDAPAHKHFDVRFLFATAANSFRAGSDAHAASWVPIAELLKGSAEHYPSDDSVLRAVRKLERML